MAKAKPAGRVIGSADTDRRIAADAKRNRRRARNLGLVQPRLVGDGWTDNRLALQRAVNKGSRR